MKNNRARIVRRSKYSWVTVATLVIIGISGLFTTALGAQTASDFQVFGVNLQGAAPWMNATGRTTTDGLLTTLDGVLSISIPSGTFIRNAAGQPQPFISALVETSPPSIEPHQRMIYAYSLGTPGATFSPTVGMTFFYNETGIPKEILESNLFIGQWDGVRWNALPSLVDTIANSVSASITNFSTYALLGFVQVPPVLAVTSPVNGAVFDTGTVTLSIDVDNLTLLAGTRPNIAGEGRVIYYLDVEIPVEQGKTAITAPGTFTDAAVTSKTWTNLAPGTHSLGIQLVQNDRTPFNPPVTAVLNVMVKSPGGTATSTIPVDNKDNLNDNAIPGLMIGGALVVILILTLVARNT
jgi:hypothetical protein